MAQPRVSACMVLYHAGDEALKVLDCLEASTESVRVYVVDNSPADEMADRIRWRYPDVKILSQKRNIGFGRANNKVLRDPDFNCKYHLLVNPDVTFAPDLLTRMIDYMENNPNCVILTPRVFNEDGTEQFLPKKQPTIRYLISGKLEEKFKTCARWRREYTLADQVIRRPIGVEFATGCFMLIRTDDFKKLGGFDERFFLYQEDSDLSRRAMDRGVIVYHPDMQVIHAWKRDNIRSVKGTMRHLISTIKFFSKWGPAL